MNVAVQFHDNFIDYNSCSARSQNGMNVMIHSREKTMQEEPIFYRRNLPHIQPKNSGFFITFRLANSLPTHVLQELRDEREVEQSDLTTQLREGRLGEREYRQASYRLQKQAFVRFDTWLDRYEDGPHWLAQDRNAQIVADEMHALHGERYRLLAFCIMSNHVHLLVDTTGFHLVSPAHKAGATTSYPLTDTLRLLKGRTARYCNQVLGRKGAFWHHESYDHVVRDASELGRIVRYIYNNPVKARLVENWEDWKFTYLSPSVAALW